jgi:Superinfection immunity protein
MHRLGLVVFSFAASAGDDTAAGIVGVIVILMLAVIALAFYFLPTLIAIFRSHHQWAAIAVINLFFGWTFIGWVISLAWSVSAARER